MDPVRDSLLNTAGGSGRLRHADITPGHGSVQTRGTPSLGLPCTAVEAAPGVHLGLEPGSGPQEASARVRVRKLPLVVPSPVHCPSAWMWKSSGRGAH